MNSQKQSNEFVVAHADVEFEGQLLTHTDPCRLSVRSERSKQSEAFAEAEEN